MLDSLPPRYVEVTRLGEGGEGGAWVGRDRDARGLKVVLKHVPAARRAQVQRAFEVLRRVASPHLPGVRELVPDAGGGAWLVSAWVDGAPLPPGPVAVADALAEAQGLAHALRAIHAVGVHHGDVSLANLIRGPAGQIVLTDFGQVGCLGCGTPGFLAPEVLAGGGGPAADIFALGCVLAARLFGEVPWRDPAEVAGLPGRGRAAARARIAALASARPEPLPPRLLALFEHLLDPDPDGRVGDLGAVLRRLREVAEGENTHAGPTWWLPARWPYRGRELGRWESLLAEIGRPRLVAVAGPAGSGRGRVIEELVQRLQGAAPAPAARLCAPERLAVALGGGDDDGWIAAWMAGEVAGAVIGAAEAPPWPGELGDAVDEPRRIRLQAAVLRAGSAAARSTVLLPVSAGLGEALAAVDDPTITVISLEPWGPEEIRGALAIALEGGGDDEALAAWIQALTDVSGGWPARVIAAIEAAARGGLPDPDPGRLAALAGDPIALDPLVAREILAVSWGEGRRATPIPGALQGLYASDGEPLGGAVAAARRVLGGELQGLARAALERARGAGGALALALLVDAGDREGLEAWLAAKGAILPAEPAVERLVAWMIDGDGPPLAPAARARLAGDLLRRGEPGRALAILDRGEADDACRLLRARALERLGRPAAALDVLEDMVEGAGDPGLGARARGLRWRALVDLGRAAEAHREALAWQADAPPPADAAGAEALTWAALAALSTGDQVRAQAWLDAAERALEGAEGPRSGLAAAAARGDRQVVGLQARIEQLRGNLAHARGDLAIAEAAYARAAERFAGAGERGGRITLAASLAALAVETGAISRGIAQGRQALRAWLALGQLQALSGLVVNLVQLLLRAGAVEEAARLQRLLAEVGGGPLADARARRVAADRLRAEALAARDRARLAEAERRYVAAAEALAAASAPREAIDAWTAAAALARQGGRDAAATRCLAAAAALLDDADARGGDLELAVTIEALAAAARRGDEPALRRAAEALARLPGSEELQRRGRLERAWATDAALHEALVAAAYPDGPRLGALVARLRTTLESIMDNVDPLDRPAVRASLTREVDPTVAALLSDLDPEDAAPRPSERAQGAGHSARVIQTYRRLAREDRIESLLAQVVDAIMELCNAERGVAVLLPWREGQARIEVVRELAQGSDGASFSHSIIDRVLASSEPILSVDATSDDRFDGSRSISHLHLRSVLGVPLVWRGEVLGAAYVDHRLRRGAFDEHDLAVVEELCELASLAIAHARTLTIQRDQAEALAAQGRELQALLEERELEVRGLREQVRGAEAPERPMYRGMVGASAAMQAVFRLIDRVADADVPVVIYGESGTGKELVARAIHDAGPRRARPFIAENCGAIPESLLESVLFGHQKGAFTGAHKASAGLFEAAHGGTIFLDEVGEMSPAMQTKLLRVLQEGEVRRVGDAVARKVDVRVIAASNRDLDAMVADGRFRGDLYYRIQVVKISLPPLRQRTEDLPALIEHFLARYDPKRRLTISAPVMRLFARHAWPGNVRELENEIQRLAVLVESRALPEDLSPQIRDQGAGGAALDPDDLTLRPRLERLERELIQRAMERAEGNQTRAAELLGLSRFGLQKKLRRQSEGE